MMAINGILEENEEFPWSKSFMKKVHSFTMIFPKTMFEVKKRFHILLNCQPEIQDFSQGFVRLRENLEQTEGIAFKLKRKIVIFTRVHYPRDKLIRHSLVPQPCHGRNS